jgi:biopolymer transport protein ExbB
MRARLYALLPLPTLFLLTTLITVAAEEAPKAEVKSVTMLGMIMGAGLPEYMLILYSVIAFAVALQNFMMIKKESIIPAGLADDLHNVLGKDGVTEEAIESARQMVDNDPSMTGKVLAAALAVHDLGHDAMLDAANDIQTTEQLRWMQKPGWMSLFANMATLLGLLGTVWGIIEAFMDMAANPAGVDITKLSSTIGISLITTANGMFIAVPMLLFAFAQRSKLGICFRESNDAVKEILNYFRPMAK